MGAYVIQRLLLMVPTVLLASVLVFTLVRLMPGDAVDTLSGDQRDEATQVAIRERLGLDQDPPRAYVTWLGHVVRGDLGFSLISGRSVPDVIGGALPVTLEFAGFGLLIALLISLPVGVLASARQDSALDYAVRGGAIAAVAMPSFWVGIMTLALPGYYFGWLPPSYVPWSESPGQHLWSMLIPSLVLGVSLSGTQLRLTRTAMLGVLREDYVRTARAKGLSGRTVILRHALRNAALPLITVVAIQLSFLLAGTVVLERVYGIPGVGQELLAAISARDYPVIQGINLVFAVLVVLIYVGVDLIYALLNPLVRFAR